MGAGLPGLGLGGLLFIILGLLAPVVEALRTIAGRSSLTRWRVALRQFTLSAAIVVALDRSFWLVDRAVGLRVGPTGSGPALPVAPVLITVLILLTVLTGATLLGWLVRPRAAQRPDAAVELDLRGEPVVLRSSSSDPSASWPSPAGGPAGGQGDPTAPVRPVAVIDLTGDGALDDEPVG